MTAAKKQRMAGFYGLSDGSTLFVGDANNPRLPKGKTGSVFYTIFGKDGKLSGSGTVDYGQKGFEDIKKSVSQDTGKIVNDLIAGDGTQEFKDLRKVMGKPDKLIGLLKGTGTALGGPSKGKEIGGDQEKPKVSQKGRKGPKKGNDKVTTKEKDPDKPTKKAVRGTSKGADKESPVQTTKPVDKPKKAKETETPKKVNGNYQGFKEPNGYFRVLMDGPTAGTKWTYDNPITGVKASVYFVNRKFASLTYGMKSERDVIYKGAPFKDLDDVNLFLIDYSKQQSQDKDKFNHIKAKNIRPTSANNEWVYHDENVTVNIRYDPKTDQFSYTVPYTTKTVSTKGTLASVSEEIVSKVQAHLKKEALSRKKKDDFARSNPVQPKYADRLEHGTLPNTYRYSNSKTGINGLIETEGKKFNVFASTKGSRFNYDLMKKGFGSIDEAVAFLDGLTVKKEAPKTDAPKKKLYPIPSGSNIIGADGQWTYNRGGIYAQIYLGQDEKIHVRLYQNDVKVSEKNTCKDLFEVDAYLKEKVPELMRPKPKNVNRQPIPQDSGIRYVKEGQWEFRKDRYKMVAKITADGTGSLTVTIFNDGKKGAVKTGFKDLFSVDTYLKGVVAKLDEKSNAPTGTKTKKTTLDKYTKGSVPTKIGRFDLPENGHITQQDVDRWRYQNPDAYGLSIVIYDEGDEFKVNCWPERQAKDCI